MGRTIDFPLNMDGMGWDGLRCSAVVNIGSGFNVLRSHFMLDSQSLY